MQLQSGGTDKFTVDKTGAASGYSLSGNGGGLYGGISAGAGNSVEGRCDSTTCKAGIFANWNTGNSNDTVTAYAWGGGRAFYGQTPNGVTGSIFYGMQYGSGNGLEIQIANVPNFNAAVRANTQAGGQAGYFEINYALNTADVIYLSTTGTGNLLNTDSGGRIDNAGNWVPPCSRKRKHDIRPITGRERLEAFGLVKNLDIVRYRYNADPKQEHTGIIAEDAPDQITTLEKDGLLETDTIFLLVTAFQEQNKTMESQQAQIEALKAEIEKLKRTQ